MATGNSQQALLVNGERLKREVDRTAGGGQKFHPYTGEEAREWIRPQLAALRESVADIPDENRGPRILFQATLFPNYLAASYFPSHLFSELDLVPVGSRSATAVYKTRTSERPDALTKSLILAGTDESLDSFVALAGSSVVTRSFRAAADQLRELAEVRLARPEEVLGPREYPDTGELLDLEAVLHPGAGSRSDRLSPVDDETFEKWVAFVEELNGQVIVDYRRTVGGLTFVPVRLVDAAVRQTVEFNPLRSLRPLPSMRPVVPGILRSTGMSVVAPVDPTPAAETKVAIFDGGTEATAVLPTCTVVDVTSEPSDSLYCDHGSGVTAAVLYGNIEPDGILPAPSVHATHYRVVPHPNAGNDPEVYWVLDQIERVVRAEQPDIVNLSLGPNISVEDSEEPNRWTSTLDELAYEHDVLFVVAAGNNGEEDRATGLNRVQVPADMANGLSVGACNVHHPEQHWLRASYSAVGPGRAGSRVQPSGVQFGGDGARPFYGVMPDGRLKATCGTSFAAPLVTHALSRLGGLLGRDRTTLNNLRAFAVHLADRHHQHEEMVLEIGHGRFAHDFEPALAVDARECLVLYEDHLDRNELVALPLPVPGGVDQGIIELAWTLVVTSPTEPSQPLEYTRASLDVVFRPHDQRYVLTKEGSRRTVDVSEDQELVGSLYADGYEIGSAPATLAVPGSYGTEDERRDSGKWETVRHFRRRFRASSLRNPQLELAYLAREGGLLAQVAPPIDYTLLVSVRGPASLDLYSMVRAQFSVLNELRAGQIQIDGGS
jgi:hypothetical protein